MPLLSYISPYGNVQHLHTKKKQHSQHLKMHCVTLTWQRWMGVICSPCKFMITFIHLLQYFSMVTDSQLHVENEWQPRSFHPALLKKKATHSLKSHHSEGKYTTYNIVLKIGLTQSVQFVQLEIDHSLDLISIKDLIALSMRLILVKLVSFRSN